MKQNRDSRNLFLAVFAVWSGVWIFFSCWHFPVPVCYVAWASGLFCGGGILYLLYSITVWRHKKAFTVEPVTAGDDAAVFPYSYFMLAMAVVEERGLEETCKLSDKQLTAQIGRRLMGAADDAGIFVAVVLLKNRMICYLNYPCSILDSQKRRSRYKEVLEETHNRLREQDLLTVRFLCSDVDLTDNELQDGIQQISDLDWYMHIFSYKPTQPVIGLEHIQQHILSSRETVASFQSRNLLQLKRQFISCFLDKNYSSAKRLINDIMTRNMMESYTYSLRTYRIAFENIKGLIMDATEAVRLQLDKDFFMAIFPEHGVNEVTTMPELRERCNYIMDKLIEYERDKHQKDVPENFVRICSYVENHMCDPSMNISTIALALDLTPTYVSRVFKENKGMALLDYIHTCRVSRAKVLLGHGRSISEVSEETGFGSVRTFSRAFQKIEGISPGVYQQEFTGA